MASSSAQSPQSPKAASPTPAAAPAALLSEEAATAAGILPASHWADQPLHEEHSDDDTASTLGSIASSTASLTSTIIEYRTHHGRTYHGEIGDAEGWEPNDKRHLESMDIAHHCFTICTGGKLFLSPLDKKKVQKVLDVGTGTGMWAIDFADEFPHAEVIGTDITPIQPSWVPPNVKFELDDCNREWTWPENTFDFINLRMLIGVIQDWDAVFREAYRTCKPGGYVESMCASCHFVSDDGSIKPGTALAQWGNIWYEGGRAFGRTFEVYNKDIQRKDMEAAGFVDIEFKDMVIPVGVWHPDKDAAERGLWWKMTLEADLEGYLNYICHTLLGWKEEETKVYCAHVRKEWNDPKIHGYVMGRVVWGRKPE
ncbi:S-adenosyl-L-methionine-dependent methyltransferase [Pseudoneurospora amorphoporcata]|uniref:S-adenosyl-L-methionine-dependent methyltransferase n=1 Tax=Pseudoneurospora amorphoporcata TaxID=241081 RepID=A0AAN6SB29_9PEZI|nr:S-adenosyl-L-methionine-dependent methyltransferase [Pseudoneurospora amorphoporcata]